MKREVYMLITDRKYQFPLLVCDSVEELAKETGKSVGYIKDAIKKAEKRREKNENAFSKYEKVVIDVNARKDR